MIEYVVTNIWTTAEQLLQLVPVGVRPLLLVEIVGVAILLVMHFTWVRRQYKEEQQWSNLCAYLTDKVDSIAPIHKKHAELFLAMILHSILSDRKLHELAKSVDPLIMSKAEQDYLLRDIAEDETTLNLILQLQQRKSQP